MSVEDSQSEWSEDVAPFVKVAEISLPQQDDFTNPESVDACENMSFNPWHALKEHRPLGAVNRVRKVVYTHITHTRHELNGADVVEPQ